MFIYFMRNFAGRIPHIAITRAVTTVQSLLMSLERTFSVSAKNKRKAEGVTYLRFMRN